MSVYQNVAVPVTLRSQKQPSYEESAAKLWKATSQKTACAQVPWKAVLLGTVVAGGIAIAAALGGALGEPEALEGETLEGETSGLHVEEETPKIKLELRKAAKAAKVTKLGELMETCEYTATLLEDDTSLQVLDDALSQIQDEESLPKAARILKRLASRFEDCGKSIDGRIVELTVKRRTNLHLAIEANMRGLLTDAEVGSLLNAGFDEVVNTKGQSDITALHMAVLFSKGDPSHEVTSMLLKVDGIDVNAETSGTPYSALDIAYFLKDDFYLQTLLASKEARFSVYSHLNDGYLSMLNDMAMTMYPQ